MRDDVCAMCYGLMTINGAIFINNTLKMFYSYQFQDFLSGAHLNVLCTDTPLILL